MRVSPDPYAGYEADFPEQEKPRRSEMVRALIFLAVNLACSAAAIVLQRMAVSLVYERGVLVGQALSLVSLAATYLTPVAAVLINRKITFRSNAPWYLAAGVMLMLRAAWQILTGMMMNKLLVDFDVNMYLRTAYALDALWLIVSYAVQRFALFRESLDTL